MTTTLQKTIKASGGTYTTMAGLAAANPNLVSLDQIWECTCDNLEDTSAVTFNGWTMDATRYLKVKAANPHATVGKITTNSYRRKTGAATNLQVIASGGLIIFEGIQFEVTSASVGCINFLAAGVTNQKVRFINCVFAGSGFGILQNASNQPWTVELINCVFTTNKDCLQASFGNIYCYSCTFIQTTGGSLPATNFTTSGTRVVKSCYARNVGGGGLFAYSNISGATVSKALSSDTSGDTDNIAYSTANFTNVTAGSEDLRPVSGSALLVAGADRSAESAPFNYVTDINGVTRPLTLDDAGAFQVTAPATRRHWIEG